jgi:hypothetical protein
MKFLIKHLVSNFTFKDLKVYEMYLELPLNFNN